MENWGTTWSILDVPPGLFSSVLCQLYQLGRVVPRERESVSDMFIVQYDEGSPRWWGRQRSLLYKGQFWHWSECRQTRPLSPSGQPASQSRGALRGACMRPDSVRLSKVPFGWRTIDVAIHPVVPWQGRWETVDMAKAPARHQASRHLRVASTEELPTRHQWIPCSMPPYTGK